MKTTFRKYTTGLKGLLIAGSFFAAIPMALAQENGQVDQDQLQQQPPRETQREVETAARRDAAKAKSEAEFQAEKQAKDKGRTQKQTTAEKPVSDTIKKPKKTKPQVQYEPKRN
ncbi:hypothetical protein [Flavobacterium sp.]|uniref:hypothetical protein n=1 Tax=Flavobacterium sp. TaxID=239 RepID=UPI00261C4D85|nr:hypothetical protein [Flavobacterium sp.]